MHNYIMSTEPLKSNTYVTISVGDIYTFKKRVDNCSIGTREKTLPVKVVVLYV